MINTTRSGLLFTHSLLPETLSCISEREEIFLAHTRFWRPIIFFPLTKLCNPKLQLIYSPARHESLLESSVQKTKNCVRKYLVLKHVNVKTQREEATTTPMVHLGKKHHVQRWRLDKIALLGKLILHSAESTSSLLIHVKTVTRFLPNEVEIN